MTKQVQIKDEEIADWIEEFSDKLGINQYELVERMLSEMYEYHDVPQILIRQYNEEFNERDLSPKQQIDMEPLEVPDFGDE